MKRIWFVTGSSRGLGREIVEAALAGGDTVVATARKPEQLNDLADQFGPRLFPLALDVMDAEAVQAAVDQVHRKFGRIDVVVNNAGYANTSAVEDVNLDDFTHQIQTNFFGVVYVCKAVVPIMREQGSGTIFQIASIGSRLTSPGLTAYQSAKFAVRGFSLGLAQEMAPLGVRVSTLQPGGMRTDWAGSSMEIRKVSPPYESTVGAFAKMIRASSGHEASDPAKVARAIVKLADREDLPAEMLIGSDAVEYAAHAAHAVAENDRKWQDFSTSVQADG